jgi:raffinose/stachyose/melibiose transport system permease protein
MRPATSRHALRGRAVGTAFLVPAGLVFAGFVLLPIFESFRLSFFCWPQTSGEPVFCGLANFAKLLGDPVFWWAAGHNVVLVVLSLAVQLPLAFGLAVLLSYRTRGQTLFRTAFFAPMVMPTTAIAVLWTLIYLPGHGLLDQFVRLFAPRFSFGWLSTPGLAMLCVFVVICWRYVGFHMVLYLAGMGILPDDVYEAARLDGAGEWQVCWHVTLPLMWPVIRVSALLSIIGSLKYFDLVYMMAGGAPEPHRDLMATYVYRLAFASGQGRYGYASAAATMLFVCALGAAIAVMICGKRRERT